MLRPVGFAIGTLFFALVLTTPDAGAAFGKKKKADAPADRPVIFYPEPPATARLQFLRTISREKDLGGATTTGKFRKFVVGAEEEVDIFIGKPYGATIHEGRIFVCDIVQGRVHIIDFEEGKFRDFGREYPGRLSTPANIAVDADGTRYVVDTGGKRVMVFDQENKFVTSFGDPARMTPTDVAVFDDALYVCDMNGGQVVVLDKETGEERRRIGQKGSAEGEMEMPTNLAVDLDGNVYVADTGKARVNKYDSRGNFVHQIGSVGDGPGRFHRPKGVAVDRKGHVYIVDAAFQNVQVFDDQAQLLMFFGVGGNVPGGLTLPATVEIDYDNVDVFADRVAPGREVEYLVIVTSQYGPNKVNVYGFLRTDE